MDEMSRSIERGSGAGGKGVLNGSKRGNPRGGFLILFAHGMMGFKIKCDMKSIL